MKTTILATIALLATTTLAQASVVFSDDFNSSPPSNIVGNGWVETEFGASDARARLLSALGQKRT